MKFSLATELETLARNTKLIAIKNSDSISYYAEASAVYGLASAQMRKEANEQKGYSRLEYKRRLIHCVYLEYHVYDCLYAYYKAEIGQRVLKTDFVPTDNDYKEAERNFNLAFDKLNVANKEILKLSEEIPLATQTDKTDDRFFERINQLLVSYKHEQLTYLLNRQEFSAKKAFDQHKYSEALKYYSLALMKNEDVKFYDEAHSEFLGEESVESKNLNDVLLHFNYSQSVIGSLDSGEFNDEYKIVAIVKQLLESLTLAAKIVELRPYDQLYTKGEQIVIKAINIMAGKDEFPWALLYEELGEGIDTLIKVLNTEIKITIPPKPLNRKPLPRNILIFLVHGINSRGTWKNDLQTLLAAESTDAIKLIPVAVDYDDFFWGFFMPWSRAKVVKDFNETYNKMIATYRQLKPERVCVAHSFGTYITGSNLLRFPEVKFNKIIFAGCILRRDFDWINIKLKCQNLVVRFELQKADRALILAKIYSFLPWVKWLSNSGKRGFDKPYPFIEICRNEYSDHSDIFGAEHMRTEWIPFIKRR